MSAMSKSRKNGTTTMTRKYVIQLILQLEKDTSISLGIT